VPKPGVVPLRPLGISELLDGAISTVRANPGVMLGFSAVVVSVVSIGTFFATLALFQDLNAATADLGESAELSDVLDAFSGSISGLLLSSLLGWFAQTILSGLLTVVVGDAVLGRKATLADAWARIRPRILPLLGLSLLIQLSWMAGLLLCVVPGIFLYVALALAPPALVLERSGVITAMKRSWRLVKGAWWRCFGVLALTAILTYVIAQVVSVPFGILSGLGGVGLGFDAADTSYSVLAVALTTLGSIVAGTITYPFTAAVTALLDVDQRMRREALDLELARAAAAPPAA
jgi:hypothetical protein